MPEETKRSEGERSETDKSKETETKNSVEQIREEQSRAKQSTAKQNTANKHTYQQPNEAETVGCNPIRIHVLFVSLFAGRIGLRSTGIRLRLGGILGWLGYSDPVRPTFGCIAVLLFRASVC